MLDNRLTLCAELVGGEGIVCDVGTDHAYLAAELINSGKCQKVIASDINEGPLKSARKTVEKYNIADKVDLVLSDGLENVPLDGVSDIVIAGMGGETIADIIGESGIDAEYDIKFILQPMTKPEVLRKKLYEYQFEIVKEVLAEDGDKLYVVMVAKPSSEWQQLTETEAIYGFFEPDDPLADKYRHGEAERLQMISENLEAAGKYNDAQHFRSMSYRMDYGTDIVKIQDIYNYLNEVYPFNTQEKWDNSGLLVENYDMECRRVLLTLDITNTVINEAAEKCSKLIISHHPVIFEPLKKIDRYSPVYKLIDNGIAAICMHTNLDIAQGGTNGVILRKFAEKFELACDPEPFEEYEDGQFLGWIVTLKERVSAGGFGESMKDIFGCEYVRMSRRSMSVSRIAICSGSGGSMLKLAISKNCDALVTGDVKHDVWISAENNAFTIFDCGHFHTENIVLLELRRVLEAKFPQLDIEVAAGSIDPCKYV